MKKIKNINPITKFFSEYLEEQLANPLTDDLDKISIYLARDDIERAKEHAHIVLDVGSRIRSSRWGGDAPDTSNLPTMLIYKGHLQIIHAIYLMLVQSDPQKVQQLFEWAAEDCTLQSTYIDGRINIGCHNEVAVPHLWHGYALVGLERYQEALTYLIQVEPIFADYKKSGGEIYQKIEYNLPKALIPLCEFKLNPTRQNLINAQNGIEEYIKSLREPRYKLWGSLYYFHLKDQFVNVYSANPKDYSDEAAAPVKEPVRKTSALKSGEPQNVWMWDVVSATSGEEFGTDNELMMYAEYVKNRGGFPVLSSLMDFYLMWDEFDARELADEAGRLLAGGNLPPEIQQKTEIIKTQAEYSAEKGSGRLVLKPEDGE